MDIQEFITETLKQIVAGVANAQGSAVENKAVINPTLVTGYSGVPTDGNVPAKAGNRTIQKVEFDIAVTITEERKTRGGLSAKLAVFSVGMEGNSGNTNSMANRVKFAVPIVFSAGD